MTTVTTQVQINASPEIVWKMLKTLHALHGQPENRSEQPAHRGRGRGHCHHRGRLRSLGQDITWQPERGFEATLGARGPIHSGQLQLALAPEATQTIVTQTLDYEPNPHPMLRLRGQSLPNRIQRHLEDHLQQLKTAAEMFVNPASSGFMATVPIDSPPAI
ncbi:MAG: SRPBCC family protein [Cyanobacteria bacterium]|nr:SRPBCC family protein [Cyanobacteriota bacterium]MDA0866058.1 SRPBCC family protein [Cyanobacteriota bacterium]